MVSKEIRIGSYYPLGKRELIACVIWGIDIEETEDVSLWRPILPNKWRIKRWMGDAKSLKMKMKKKTGEIRGSHNDIPMNELRNPHARR